VFGDGEEAASPSSARDDGWRERAAARLGAESVVSSVIVGTSFLFTAVPLAVFMPEGRSLSLPTLVVLIAMYAATSRIELEVGRGSVVPTQLVLVPMLFLLPARIVPLAVAAGYLLGHLTDHVHGRGSLVRSFAGLASSWHAVGPAIVFTLVEHLRGEPVGASGIGALIYLGAFGAQVCFDVAAAGAHNRLVHDKSMRFGLRDMGLAYALDLMFTPVGVMAVATVDELPYAFVALLPLAWLFAILARERRTRLEQELELSQAYRGTAFLLGDVVEANDFYTGTHSQAVVDLVLAVVDELGLGERERRRAEFAALLHDVGKIRIPNAIIRKPGPLTDEERRIVQTHPMEGQALLERIGGLLGEVGVMVRSHHERWDGGGYPDGLRGEEIPLVSRIIAACDTLHAMTTDRPYRRALPLSVALAELRSEAGGQFDPQVVEALIRIVARQGEPEHDRVHPPVRLDRVA
jgi:HD-GYP domain-containing protein (c-di-GMP phosphodiesterase class II)